MKPESHVAMLPEAQVGVLYPSLAGECVVRAVTPERIMEAVDAYGQARKRMR